MFRTTLCLLVAAWMCSPALAAHGPEIVDPEELKSDVDFALQGEYLGNGTLPGDYQGKIGGQVIALGNEQFRAVLFCGGLPGAKWQRGDAQFTLEGKRDGETAELSGGELAGTLQRNKLTIRDAQGKPLVELKPAHRKSTTLGEKPPQGATVLFDGSTAEPFDGGKLTGMKTLEAGTTAKEQYRMRRLHLEFRLSWKPTARGQGRSNSGVYIGGIPEIQVLDSFGLEGLKNECGALYGRRVPDVNMCLPPLVWQTFDVEFTDPKRDADGQPEGNILVTVRHNGVVIHEGYDTGRREHEPRRLHLQKHGNRVQYRNIWLVPVPQ